MQLTAPALAPSSLRAIGPESAAARAHAAIGNRAFPRFIESAVANVREQLVERRRGSLFDAIEGARGDRQRGLRSDACLNIASVLTALLYGMDAASLFVRTPSGSGGMPERHRWTVYDHRAFGPQVEDARSIKRTFRASATLQAAGLLQVRELGEVQGSQYRSKVSHKRITVELLRLLGMLNAWKAVQRAREQERAKGLARRAATLAGIGRKGKRAAGSPALSVEASSSTATAPAPSKPAGPSAAAKAALEDIGRMLGRRA